MQKSQARLMEDLRARMAALENRPVLAGAAVAPGKKPSGPLAIAPGRLHELFTPEQRNGGALLGFALALARDLVTPERPAVLFVHLVREGQDLGLPFGGGLAAFGLAPEHLVLVRAASMVEFLWAMEEAICCRAVAAVIGEVAVAPKILDFTASRRLSLRAQAGGTSAFLLRYGRGREASAAGLRWQVLPEESGEAPFDPKAPGEARWRVHLEKGGHGASGQTRLLGWTKNGLVELEYGSTAYPGPRSASAPHGPVPAALADGLPQTA